MKTYRAKFNPKSKNVYGVSLVENPAMEGDFIKFSKQEQIKFAEYDKEKRRVMGLILEPNKLVYRRNDNTGEEFNIVFTEQDIEDVAYNFQKQSNQNNSTIEHDGKLIDGVSFVETWLVENPAIDKSSNFGFSYPKGSWMGVMQIDNEEVWSKYVETGEVLGFSIDAFMQLEEINLNTNKMSENKDANILEFLKELPKQIALALKPEQPKEKEVEMKEEVKAEEEVELKETEKEIETKVEFNQDQFFADFLKELEAVFNPLKEEVAELKTQLSAQNEKIVELEKQPATTSIKKNPTQLDLSKSYNEMSNLEKMEYNLKNKRG